MKDVSTLTSAPKHALLPQNMLHSSACSCHQHPSSLGRHGSFPPSSPGPGLGTGPHSAQRHILAFPASLPEPELSSLLGSRHWIIIGSNFNYDFAKDRFFPQMGIFYISLYQKQKLNHNFFPTKSTSVKSSNNRAQTCCFWIIEPRLVVLLVRWLCTGIKLREWRGMGS